MIQEELRERSTETFRLFQTVAEINGISSENRQILMNQLTIMKALRELLDSRKSALLLGERPGIILE